MLIQCLESKGGKEITFITIDKNINWYNSGEQFFSSYQNVLKVYIIFAFVQASVIKYCKLGGL